MSDTVVNSGVCMRCPKSVGLSRKKQTPTYWYCQGSSRFMGFNIRIFKGSEPVEGCPYILEMTLANQPRLTK